MENQTKNEIERFVIDWNSFPIDYWWRKKYNIPFGSSQHREMNFIDMTIEWKEELHFNRINSISGGNEDFSQSEIDDDYEDLDLSQFDKK